MRILFVSVEVSPFAKVGGLADVVGSLPMALQAEGHDVRVVMPLYRMIEDDPKWFLHTSLANFDVQMNPHWTKSASFKETEYEGVPFGFIGTDEWFPLAVDSGSVYQPGGMQHLFFSKAVLAAMKNLDWIPDVIHCHDWHTGFIPVLMREQDSATWEHTAAVYTIHNHAYQGLFDIDVLDTLGLPRSLFTPDKVEAWGRVNFLKAGSVYADHVNTVSETYAKEIQTPAYGEMLEGLMAHLSKEGKLSGIVNGIDMKQFDPETDPALVANFSWSNWSAKADCRESLRIEMGLPNDESIPLVGMISRLSMQKGYDLVIAAATELMATPIQLVVQGLGDPMLAGGLRLLEQAFPGRVRFVEEFNPGLAQRIYGGCDAFLMPSAFEPCGLGQLIAMRYGTIPVVRRTGGLADTVTDGKNGFSFEHISAPEMVTAVARMANAFKDPVTWAALVQNAMNYDASWTASARKYDGPYKKAVAERRVACLVG